MTRPPAGVLAVALLAAACSPGASLPAASPTGAAATPPEATAVGSVVPSPAPSNQTAVGRIVFDAGPAGLAVVGLDGSAPVPIPGTTDDGAPTCTPDGSRIAFSKDQLFVAGLDGSGRIQLTHLKGLVADVPAFSADGTALAFVAHPSSGDAAMATELDVIRLDGSSLVTIAEATPSGDRPAWRPDGASIMFSNASNGGLAEVGFPSGAVSRRTNDDDSFAAWSPDRATVVFERGVSLPDGTDQHHIFLLRGDGSLAQITAGPADDEFPTWSPDGNWIAFTRFDGTHPAALFRVRPDGTGLAAIPTPGSASASWPCWIS